MHYHTFEPHPQLAAFVKCYWTLEAAAEAIPVKQRIVPDGCMEMIFQCGDVYKQYLSAKDFIIQPRSFVFGQITVPLDIEPLGVTNIFSVRFHPDGFTPFTTTPPSAMENKATALDVLFGSEGISIEKAITEAQTTAERISLIETFLMSRMFMPESADSIIRSSVALIFALKGGISVDALSGQLNVHRRKLERRFASVTGLSPKQLSKMVRLQATLRQLYDNRFTSFTSAAHDGNYYDQAHFIRDFKEFTGVSPKHFYADNLRMSAFFIGSE